LDPAVFPAIKKFVQSSKHVQSIPAYEQSYIFEVLFHLLDFTSFGWDIVAFGGQAIRDAADRADASH
jgi:hypothetical protein